MMKITLTLLALVALAEAGPNQADTCANQKGCVDFTTELVGTGGVCSGGDCTYKICMTFDTTMATCAKEGAISHMCLHDTGETECLSETPGVIPTFEDAVEHTSGDILTTGTQCVMVAAGATASFLFKDGSGCEGADDAWDSLDGTVHADCKPRHADLTSCTGNKEYIECVWTVVAPTECPSETTTTAAPPATTTVAPPATTTAAPPATTTVDTPFKTSGGGGDPHFARWGQEHDTFHGECDLVLIHSEKFQGVGLDLHARTTIQDYFSYIETAALRLGNDVVQFYKTYFLVNGEKFHAEDLPMQFGNGYTISETPVPENKRTENRKDYSVDLNDGSQIRFRFYKQFLTMNVDGHPDHFEDAVGLLGEYTTGAMVGREGEAFDDFTDFGFEWQVRPDQDPELFAFQRSPQLPFEQCRMPTAARPARRALRGDTALLGKAQEACAHVPGSSYQLCIDDIMTTGDLGLADIW